MRILRHADPDFTQALASLQRTSIPRPEVEATVREIIAAVRKDGDAALLDYTEHFGGPKLSAKQLRVTSKTRVSRSIRDAIVTAHANVRAFAQRSLRRSWSMRNAQGAKVGERFDPFERVGIYVPGGTAPLVSTAVMTVTLAAAAGVPGIVVTTPCDRDGRINEALLFALHYCGATEIHRVGGAQAIAALAHGTETIRPVQKIFGPGNAYVVEAKRQVFGRVAIDLLPGPSEIFVLADTSANAAWVAADLLAQAEHGHHSSIIFVTNSMALLERVQREIARQLRSLNRQDALSGVLENDCALICVKSLRHGVALANEFAPEHVSLVTRDNARLAARIVTAGAIFLGGYSPVVGGGVVGGPSHTLPTGGAGKSFSGLTVEMFQRRTSIVQLDANSLKKSIATIAKFSEIEGLDAHGRSATIRFES